MHVLELQVLNSEEYREEDIRGSNIKNWTSKSIFSTCIKSTESIRSRCIECLVWVKCVVIVHSFEVFEDRGFLRITKLLGTNEDFTIEDLRHFICQNKRVISIKIPNVIESRSSNHAEVDAV